MRTIDGMKYELVLLEGKRQQFIVAAGEYLAYAEEAFAQAYEDLGEAAYDDQEFIDATVTAESYAQEAARLVTKMERLRKQIDRAIQKQKEREQRKLDNTFPAPGHRVGVGSY